MPSSDLPVVDMHVHVGLVGDLWPQWGRMSTEYRSSLVFKTFLLYARIAEDQVCDELLREKTLQAVAESSVDYIVGLALDPVYTPDGRKSEARSHLWVANDYIIDLRAASNGRILFGASVHPYAPDFRERVRECVDQGAVLLKWLPSAQQIDLEDLRVGLALEFLASAGKDGRPLPLLLHCGPEYAIPSTDIRTTSYDYLHWSSWDSFVNFLRFTKRWHPRNEQRIRANLERGLNAGAVIIFAHCGLPYFFGNALGRIFEHNEADQVASFLQATTLNTYAGKCMADVSALATPFRKSYFKKVKALPQDLLVYGSDFPTPVFELSADAGEMIEDFKAVVDGHLDRIIVPEDNLLDVNLREMRHYFAGSPLFTNFARHGFL